MKLRVADFLRKLDGSIYVVVVENNKIAIRGALEKVNKQCDKSFDPLEGFDNPVWEMQVVNFKMNKYGAVIVVA